MKKGIFFIVALIILAQLRAVYAIDNMYKAEQNPLEISLPQDYTSIFQSHVIYHDGLFRGVFSAQHSSGIYNLIYADSTDAQHWEHTREILAIGKDLGTPRIFIHESTIRLYYSKQFNNSYAIYSVSCSPDFTCDYNDRLELTPVVGTWDADDVASPFLFEEKGTYWLLYSGWKNNGWKIGMAYSTDAHNWIRCPNNPILLSGDGPFMQKEGDRFILYYHKPDASGIFKTQTDGELTCNSQWSESTQVVTKDQSYDTNHIIAPSIINKDGHTYLFYTGRDTENTWHLIEATDTPQETTFAVVIPGFGASWNRHALLHGKIIPAQDWKIAPFVHEYEGLLQTFEALHFKEDEDYMVFPYDWRRQVEESADELYTHLKNTLWIKYPGRKITIIGHSLGGLVGRAFTQKHPNLTNRLITVGTPHRGVVQAYSPLEAGELEKSDSLLWLGQRMLLALEKKGIETDKQTLSRTLPVLFDLFPTYDFLIDQNEQAVSYSSLSIQNSLVSLSAELSSQLYVIYGSSVLTPTLLSTRKVSGLQKVLQNYSDGEPIRTIFQNGDGLVPIVSSLVQSKQSISLQLNHGELMYTKSGIEKILQFMPPHLFAQNALKEGSPTVITPSLIFMVQSPVVLTVVHDDINYKEQDGIVFIPQAKEGNYTITVQGIENGEYTIHIGHIAHENTIWEKIRGKIVNNPPETHTYTVRFNPQHAVASIPSPTTTTTPTPTTTTITTPTTTPANGSNQSQTNASTVSTSEKTVTGQIINKDDVSQSPTLSKNVKNSSAILGTTTHTSKNTRTNKKYRVPLSVAAILLLVTCSYVFIKRRCITFHVRMLLQKLHLLQ